MREKYGREVCQIRRTSGGNYQASRVIVLTDKPQKPLPAAVWEVSVTNATGDWQSKHASNVERAQAYEAAQ